jgi:hypothetical protein
MEESGEQNQRPASALRFAQGEKVGPTKPGAQHVVPLRLEDDLGDGLVGGVGDADGDVSHAHGVGNFFGFTF